MEVLAQTSPQGLMQTVIISKSGQSEKVGEIVFSNSYNPPPKPYPETGDSPALFCYMGLAILSLTAEVYVLKKEKQLNSK